MLALRCFLSIAYILCFLSVFLACLLVCSLAGWLAYGCSLAWLHCSHCFYSLVCWPAGLLLLPLYSEMNLVRNHQKAKTKQREFWSPVVLSIRLLLYPRVENKAKMHPRKKKKLGYQKGSCPQGQLTARAKQGRGEVGSVSRSKPSR